MKKIIVAITVLLVCTSINAQTIKEGLKVNAFGNYTIARYGGKSHDQVGSGILGVGYQFNKYIYAGVSVGLSGPTYTSFDDPNWIAPMMADVQFSMPWCRFTPICDIAFGGSAISFGNDAFKDSKYLLFDFLPGISFRMNTWLSLQGNVGYEYRNVIKGAGENTNGFAARFGLVFDLSR